MPKEQTYLALCSLTKPEYETLTVARNPADHEQRPTLYTSALATNTPIFESDLPQVIIDAMLTLTTGEVTEDDTTTEALLDLDEVDLSFLSLEEKSDMMDVAQQSWSPIQELGNHTDGSFWNDEAQAAREFLDAHPQAAAAVRSVVFRKNTE